MRKRKALGVIQEREKSCTVRQEPIWAGLTQWSGADADGKAILNGVSAALASSPSPTQTVSQGLPEAEFPRLLNRL